MFNHVISPSPTRSYTKWCWHSTYLVRAWIIGYLASLRALWLLQLNCSHCGQRVSVSLPEGRRELDLSCQNVLQPISEPKVWCRKIPLLCVPMIPRDLLTNPVSTIWNPFISYSLSHLTLSSLLLVTKKLSTFSMRMADFPSLIFRRNASPHPYPHPERSCHKAFATSHAATSAPERGVGNTIILLI